MEDVQYLKLRTVKNISLNPRNVPAEKLPKIPVILMSNNINFRRNINKFPSMKCKNTDILKSAVSDGPGVTVNEFTPIMLTCFCKKRNFFCDHLLSSSLHSVLLLCNYLHHSTVL